MVIPKQNRKRQWIAAQTQHNLQDLCACVAIQMTSGPTFLFRSSELVLEQWFGFLRGQFTSSQMRCRDFLHASAKKCLQQKLNLKNNPPRLNPKYDESPGEAVTDVEFSQCAERALNSALKLMAVCTECLGQISQMSQDESLVGSR